MKNLVIAALIVAVTVGGVVSVFAQSQTTANVEVTVWQRVSDGSLYLSTRPEGGRWSTSDAIDMSALSRSGRFRQGSAITVAVPVEVEAGGPATCGWQSVSQTIRDATVRVRTPVSFGTAFHIGGGRYVTAAHVSDGHSSLSLYTNGGRVLAASIIAQGAFSGGAVERDIAILSAAPIAAALPWREVSEADRDIAVRAYGYPWSSRGDNIPPVQVSSGIVSSVETVDGVRLIQTDAGVDRGMSGGPLVDECGSVLGVTSFLPATDNPSDPAAFAGFIAIAEMERLTVEDAGPVVNAEYPLRINLWVELDYNDEPRVTGSVLSAFDIDKYDLDVRISSDIDADTISVYDALFAGEVAEMARSEKGWTISQIKSVRAIVDGASLFDPDTHFTCFKSDDESTAEISVWLCRLR